MDVVPVQAEGFAFAEAGADEELDQVGEVRIGCVAVAEEADCLGRGPDGAFGGGRAWQHGGPDDVHGESVLADGVADRAGEGGEDVPDGGASAACGELGLYEVVGVFVGEFVQADRAEGRDQVVVDERGVEPARQERHVQLDEAEKQVARAEREGVPRPPTDGGGLSLPRGEAGTVAADDAGREPAVQLLVWWTRMC
ncbi:hypothetical protein AB0P37_34000 [Streptomyces antimycoticus]|uniref:hypothetical protein n=1 Tax=Streptomyces antimycoticus TaxID=68175 RepID=UPI0034306436